MLLVKKVVALYRKVLSNRLTAFKAISRNLNNIFEKTLVRYLKKEIVCVIITW